MAAAYDAGILLSRYDAAHRRFGPPDPVRKFWRGSPLTGLWTHGIWPQLAWSADGESLLYETYWMGLLIRHLPTGRKRVVVPAVALRSPRDHGTHGLDWGAADRWVAYAEPGDLPAVSGPYDPETLSGEDSGKRSTLWLVRSDGRQRRVLGPGSRPRFSPSGRLLLALDRLEDRFALGLRLYDLGAGSSSWVRRDVLAACFAGADDRIAAVLANGDVVLLDVGGAVLRRLADLPSLLPPRTLPPPPPLRPVLRRADIDW